MFIIIMGVSGSGKTTVGQALAQRLGWPFYDGDDLHPEANIAKMAAGVPLDDADRAGWLAALATIIAGGLARGASGVVACSALKARYRAVLQAPAAGAGQVEFVYLRGSYGAILARMQRRPGHFMPPRLLQSQFDTLEEPTGVMTIDAMWALEDQLREIVHQSVGQVIKGR